MPLPSSPSSVSSVSHYAAEASDAQGVLKAVLDAWKELLSSGDYSVFPAAFVQYTRDPYLKKLEGQFAQAKRDGLKMPEAKQITIRIQQVQSFDFDQRVNLQACWDATGQKKYGWQGQELGQGSLLLIEATVQNKAGGYKVIELANRPIQSCPF